MWLDLEISSPFWGNKYQGLRKAKYYEYGFVHDVYFWAYFNVLDFPSTDLLAE